MDAPDFPQQGSHQALGVTSTTNFKFKTQLCRSFIATGRCKFGHTCSFAHSSKDRRGNEVFGQNPKGVSESMPKRGGCRYFITNRECPFGSKCVFKHEGFDKYDENCDSMLRERHAIDIQTRDSDVKTNPCLKTKLCRRWMMHNACPYGDKCNYAHGKTELVQSVQSTTGSELGNSVTTMKIEKKDDLLYNTAGNQTVEHEIPQTMCLLKWKTTKKIVGIYADWIDED